jgi:cytochrome c peroxidase
MKSKARQALCVLAAVLLAGVSLAGPFNFKGIDGWSAAEIAVLSTMRLSELPPVPKDPSNAYEASPAAIRLGQRIFSDRRFSGNNAVSCASCHLPDQQFQDGRPLGLGVGTGGRRTMPVVAAGYSPFLFWDGRKDSLWSQALGPLEDPVEHGGNRLAFAHVISAAYRTEYEAIFGVMPDLHRLPGEASPLGTAAQKRAWDAMGDDARREISRVFANMGKALAAYQKTLQYGESRLDRYVEAVVGRDAAAAQILNASERNGLRIFIGKAQCITCHNGSLLTDQGFHNTGIVPRVPGRPDPGRRAGIAKARDDVFNCLGVFSDARPEQCEELRFLATDDHGKEAAFKTPSLRNVALRAPYMHAGQLASLGDVVRHYSKAPSAAAGHSELKPFMLSEEEVKDLVAFLGTLSGTVLEEPRKK